MLPQHFESALYLPFNHNSLKGEFEFLTPDQDPGHADDDDASVCWLIVQGGKLLVEENSGDLLRTRPRQLGSAPLFIGRWRGAACYVAPYSRSLPTPSAAVAVDMQSDDPQLPIELLSLGALGRQMLAWQKNSQFCSSCASKMEFMAGQWGKQCRGCGRQHYPHVHPCIIVLIHCGDEVLLTRKSNWVPGRYGLVAGFVEPGECLEEALEREVLEETAVKVKNIKYICSQAWPFPSQIMMGFTADYADGEVVVDTGELEDVRWFHKDNLPLLPSRRSIARFLLDHYL